jgi:hypothetical protein
MVIYKLTKEQQKNIDLQLCNVFDIYYTPKEYNDIIFECNPDYSSSRPGEKNGMFGLTGEKCPHYGKKHSDTRKNNISKGLKGYKKSKEHLKNLGETHAKTYLITYPDGTEKVIKGLQKFCKENGLTNTLMNCVANGKQSHHKGFKCKYL